MLRARSASKDEYTRFGSFYIRLSDKLVMTDHFDSQAKRSQVEFIESVKEQKSGDGSTKNTAKMVDIVKLDHQDKDCFTWKELFGAQDKSTRFKKAEKRMNIRPNHASAWKGDLLIHAYCETRITLSTEFKKEVI